MRADVVADQRGRDEHDPAAPRDLDDGIAQMDDLLAEFHRRWIHVAELTAMPASSSVQRMLRQSQQLFDEGFFDRSLGKLPVCR